MENTKKWSVKDVVTLVLMTVLLIVIPVSYTHLTLPTKLEV